MESEGCVVCYDMGLGRYVGRGEGVTVVGGLEGWLDDLMRGQGDDLTAPLPSSATIGAHTRWPLR